MLIIVLAICEAVRTDPAYMYDTSARLLPVPADAVTMPRSLWRCSKRGYGDAITVPSI